jgi:hypothetical protein
MTMLHTELRTYKLLYESFPSGMPTLLESPVVVSNSVKKP